MLLIGLHKSWAPVHTALTLDEKSEKPEITSTLKQFKANKLFVAAPGPPELSLAESALYIKS